MGRCSRSVVHRRGPRDRGDSVASQVRRAGSELAALDRAAYTAVASTPSPTVDATLQRVSRAANYSRLWLSIAGVLSLLGRRNRRGAVLGVAAIGLTSAVVNAVVKPMLARRRPAREPSRKGRTVRMPASTSFPSGHAASAFAFASAVGAELPWLHAPLQVLATTVAYSRVHTGVHYPGDVLAGACVGTTLGTLTQRVGRRLLG
jgi:membrane-associated phospholipid phosphatase